MLKVTQKERLDIFVFSNNFTESREKAKALIMSGAVFVNNQKADKVGTLLKPGDIVDVRENPLKYVSRGGLKLEKAIKYFNINLKDFICADIGASTGGFTDCMLQNGASKIYSIDVGYGQLDWKLRCNEKVVNLERTNFRYVTNKEVPDKLDFASVDVSFISLKLILPVLKNLLKETATAVLLIKPQFEAGKDKVGKKGVVKDVSVHKEVIENVNSYLIVNDFKLIGLSFSPIKGPEGNIEYLAYISKNIDNNFKQIESGIIENIVNSSHLELDWGNTMNIIIHSNFLKPNTESTLKKVKSIFENSENKIFYDDDNEETIKLADLIITIGGDGTFIHHAKKAALYNKPILGINSGRIGYLAGIEIDEINLLNNILANKYQIEDRMMLKVELNDEVFYCLNDCVISKGATSRMIDISLSLNNDIINYRADGLIAATPTGSTAYSLSAGGPIADPSVESIIITPICAQTITARSCYLNPDSILTVKANSPNETDIILTVDGELSRKLNNNDIVKISKEHNNYVRLINLNSKSFFNKLSEKLKVGE